MSDVKNVDVTTHKKFSRNGFQISKHKFNRVLKLAENSGFSIQSIEENSTDVKNKSKKKSAYTVEDGLKKTTNIDNAEKVVIKTNKQVVTFQYNDFVYVHEKKTVDKIENATNTNNHKNVTKETFKRYHKLYWLYWRVTRGY